MITRFLIALFLSFGTGFFPPRFLAGFAEISSGLAISGFTEFQKFIFHSIGSKVGHFFKWLKVVEAVRKPYGQPSRDSNVACVSYGTMLNVLEQMTP